MCYRSSWPNLTKRGFLFKFRIWTIDIYTGINVYSTNVYISSILLQCDSISYRMEVTNYKKILHSLVSLCVCVFLLRYTIILVSDLTTSIFYSLLFLTVIYGRRPSLFLPSSEGVSELTSVPGLLLNYNL